MISEFSLKSNSKQTVYRTAIYLRLSREDGDKDESDSISNQRKLIQDYVKNKTEFCVVDEYVDDGYSGSNFERPSWKQLYEDLECGAVNCIIVKDLSRFGRNYIEVGRYLQMIFPGAPTPMDYMKSQGKYKNLKYSNGWEYTGVQKILKNRVYAGDTVYNTAGKGEYKVISDTHEALVDKETFEIISAEMGKRGKKKSEALQKGASRAEKYPNILQGIFYCGDCGHAMLYDRTGNSQHLRNFRYRCSDYSSYRKDNKNAPPCAVKVTSVPEQVVYKFVLDQIRHQLRAGLEVEKLEKLLNIEAKEKKRQIDILKDQELGLKQKLRKLYEDYVDRTIDEEEYGAIRKEYTVKIKNIQEQLSSIESGAEISNPRAELKKKLFNGNLGNETVGTIHLTETSSVEILKDDEPDMVERLLRRGLTRELAVTMIERLEYSVDGRFSIKFKCDDYVQKLVMRRLELDMADLEGE